MPQVFIKKEIISAESAIAELIEQIKKTSSKWIKALDAQFAAFSGNTGMAPFR
jgi:hypothetical protein